MLIKVSHKLLTVSLKGSPSYLVTVLDFLVVFIIFFSFQVSAVESLEGPLLQVEGLSDLRLELHSKKMNLHLVLIDELHRHLYIKSTSRVVQQNKEKGRMRLVKEEFCGGVEF